MATEETYINLVNTVSEVFGMATFDAKDMIVSGNVTIDGKSWSSVDGFNIPLSEVDGKEIEIDSNPKSIKFILNASELNEYRSFPSE